MSASQSFINQPSTSALSSSAQIGGPVHDPSAWGCLCNECLNNFINERLEKAELFDATPNFKPIEIALERLKERQVNTAVSFLHLKRKIQYLSGRQRLIEKRVGIWKGFPSASDSSPAARCSKKATHNGKRFIIISDDEDDAGH